MQMVYYMNPLVTSIESAYEALMVIFNIVLILGVWNRQVSPLPSME
jgi:hypothetical protein